MAIAWALRAWGFSPWWALFAVFNPTLGVTGYWAQSYWGGAVAATGGALAIGAARLGNGWILGVALAVLANSRPYEGVVLGLGVTAFLVYPGGFLRNTLLTMLVVLVPVAIWMGFYNYRVTGNSITLPYQVYSQTYEVAPKFIFQGLASFISLASLCLAETSFARTLWEYSCMFVRV